MGMTLSLILNFIVSCLVNAEETGTKTIAQSIRPFLGKDSTLPPPAGPHHTDEQWLHPLHESHMAVNIILAILLITVLIYVSYRILKNIKLIRQKDQ